MDTQQMLGVLLNTTEQQSQTTEKLLAALKGQIEALNAATQAAQKAASTVEAAARNAAPAIQKAAGEAVGGAVRDSLAGASQTASAALETAVKPIIGNLSSVVQAAHEAEGSMRNAGAWFAWKWVAVAAGGLAGVCLVAYASLAWEMHKVESLSEQKAALQADVLQLQAGVADLEKRGGRIVMNKCDGRLCIEANSNQGADQDGTAIPLGGWHTIDGGNVALVIPRGY